MSEQADPPVPAVLTDDRRWWLGLLVGVVAIGVGVAVFAWPEATVRVVGFLFGLNLLVTGTVRAVILPFLPEYPVRHRVLGVTLGVLTAVVGLVCLFNVVGSVVFLVLVVGLGWLHKGLYELFAGLTGGGEPQHGWRVATGLAHVLAGLAVIAWPKLSLATFLAIGALFLIIGGIAQIAGAVATRRGSAVTQDGQAHG